MSELLPCPFCKKGKAYTIKPARYGKSWGVLCECGAFLGFEYTEAEAIARWNSRATRGTLTAEQVRETVEKHWHDLPDEYDMPEATALPEYSYDWQVIADELNSRAERTCKQSRLFNLVWSECSSESYEWHGNELPNYCPNCGAKVRNE